MWDVRPTSPGHLRRSRIRWEDNVPMEAGRLGILNWRATGQNKAAWSGVFDAEIGLRAL